MPSTNTNARVNVACAVPRLSDFNVRSLSSWLLAIQLRTYKINARILMTKYAPIKYRCLFPCVLLPSLNDVSNVSNETADAEEGKIFIWPLRVFDGIVRWIDLLLLWLASFRECSWDGVLHALKLKHNSLLLFYYDSSLLK